MINDYDKGYADGLRIGIETTRKKYAENVKNLKKQMMSKTPITIQHSYKEYLPKKDLIGVLEKELKII